MTYWTMDESDSLPAATLCEDHALQATNLGAALFGLGPWGAMAAAALELETLTAVFGSTKPKGAGFEFSTSELGTCEACEDQKEAGAA